MHEVGEDFFFYFSTSYECTSGAFRMACDAFLRFMSLSLLFVRWRLVLIGTLSSTLRAIKTHPLLTSAFSPGGDPCFNHDSNYAGELFVLFSE